MYVEGGGGSIFLKLIKIFIQIRRFICCNDGEVCNFVIFMYFDIVITTYA
jgi:hypothetical protein